MHLFNDLIRDISNIDKAKLDIDSFKNNYKEDQFLDFKQSSPINPISGKPIDYCKEEFVKDISALANTSGGCIIYGAEENDDRSLKSLVPFVCDDIDQLQSTLGQIIHSRIEPQLRGYEFFPIRFSSNKWVLIVNVPPSFSAPHAVSTPGNEHLKFFYRTSEGSNRAFLSGMLKSAFIKSGNISDRIKLYHQQRVSQLSNYETPVSMHRHGLVILHLVPLSAFQSDSLFAVNNLYDQYHPLKPIHDASVGRSRRRNMDGLLVHGNTAYGSHYGYTQLHRNGILESVDSFMLKQQHGIEEVLVVPGDLIEQKIVESLTRFSTVLDSIGVSAPLYCFITISGVKGYTVRTGKNIPMSNFMPIDRDVLLFPEFELSQFPRDFREASQMLKDTFDMMWQSSNYHSSPNYDQEGNYSMLDSCESAA